MTRDFGRELLSSATRSKLREEQTAMRLLQRQQRREDALRRPLRPVDRRPGGRGRRRLGDWFYFVNGFEADVGAAEYELSPGDVVQWDYRNWRGTPDVRAIVGAFPEPFVHGIEGKRRPVRVECADAERGVRDA